jgi:hypothetical protein
LNDKNKDSLFYYRGIADLLFIDKKYYSDINQLKNEIKNQLNKYNIVEQ